MKPSRETCLRAILWDWANGTGQTRPALLGLFPEGNGLFGLPFRKNKKERIAMNTRKTLLVLVTLALLSLLPACCGLAETTGIAVTDMTGRSVALSAPATRVVALTAADCEILCALGAEDLLVGRGEYCDYPASVLEVPAVQSGLETNLEQIIALEPQVLLMSTMAQTEQQVAQLEAAGITVVVSEATDIEGVYTAIEMIGALVGRDAEAETLIAGMQNDFAELSAQAAGSGKSVYFEVSPLQYGLWTAGKGTFMDEVAQILGLTNCFDDVDGWAEVSQEQVIARDPDYIVTISMYYGEGLTPAEEICAREGWQDIDAVKNGAVLNLPDNQLTRPGPRLTEGAELLNEFILETIGGENAA